MAQGKNFPILPQQKIQARHHVNNYLQGQGKARYLQTLPCRLKPRAKRRGQRPSVPPAPAAVTPDSERRRCTPSTCCKHQSRGPALLPSCIWGHALKGEQAFVLQIPLV